MRLSHKIRPMGMRRQSWPKCRGVIIRGRLFDQRDVVLIRDVIRRHPDWNRTKISQRVCQLLGWIQLNGLPKERACRTALSQLELLGFLRLPPPQQSNCGGKPPKAHDLNDARLFGPPVDTMPHRLEIRPVSTPDDARLWNSAVARHHYLGLTTPVGKLLRYLFFAEDVLLGAISFTGACWSTKARSTAMTAIGLDPSPAPEFIVSNNRFIILPNVTVKNLASRMISGSIRSLRTDWSLRYSHAPLFAETFVDTDRFKGTSYLAANWIPVGMTKGYAKRGHHHFKHERPKLLLLRGICPRFHARLAQAYGGYNGR